MRPFLCWGIANWWTAVYCGCIAIIHKGLGYARKQHCVRKGVCALSVCVECALLPPRRREKLEFQAVSASCHQDTGVLGLAQANPPQSHSSPCLPKRAQWCFSSPRTAPLGGSVCTCPLGLTSTFFFYSIQGTDCAFIIDGTITLKNVNVK